jgi:hypothetical protein
LALESCQRRRAIFLGVVSIVLRVVSLIALLVVARLLDGASTGIVVATGGTGSASVGLRMSGIGNLSDFAAVFGPNAIPIAV